MAQKQYRQQSGSTLGLLSNCPSCSPQTSYSATACSSSATYNIHRTNGFNGSQSILLSQTYNIGDVVYVKASAIAPIICATITGINSSAPSSFIDVVSGPWNNCASCVIP
tara:strand:+ start:4306 stop:4635 length:330 start_codon:yes stop_codon:yes gene_type:complete